MSLPRHEGSSTQIVKYHVQTSDVLQDMQVNVSLNGQSEVLWHKERFLEDKEIVEHIIHNATNTICWTIHRPLRGWYIRIRSPSFPPGVFIQLAPVPNDASYHVDAALSFSSRTNVPIPLPSGASYDRTHVPMSRDSVDSQSTGRSSIHSYPPTPSTSTPSSSPPKHSISLDSTSSAAYAVPIHSSTSGSSENSKSQTTSSTSAAPNNSLGSIPSASSSTSTLVSPTPPISVPVSKTRTRPRPLSHIPSAQITQFVLAPSSVPPPQTQGSSSGTGFFLRALSVLKSHRPSHSNSFTLSRLLKGPNGGPALHGRTSTTTPSSSGPQSPPPPYASTAALTSDPQQRNTSNTPDGAQPQSASALVQPILHAPLLTFHDQTSLLTVRSLSGLIEIDKEEERQLGVDTSFWIAVALTYLEFLEERESYLAALSD